MNELYRKLAEETRQIEISPRIERRLLREFRVRQTLPPALFALAACLLAAVWLKPRPEPKPELPPRRETAQVQQPVSQPAPKRRHKSKPVPKESPFLRIPYSMPLAPNERAEMIRVEMPVSALAAAGIRIATADTGAKAQADLIVGEDGMARAVRIVSISNVQ
jgi:hypothetical protein